MTWYLVIGGLLTVLALSETANTRRRTWQGVFAAFILIMFVGLRYETGYDWMEYEYYYNYVPSLGHDNLNFYEPNLFVEPGFAALNIIIKSLGLSFQSLLLFIGAFNIIIIYKLAHSKTPAVAIIFVWYFGLLAIPGQMAAIRNCLSYSFIFMALLARDNQKLIAPIIYCAIAVSFHVFSVVFVPFLFLKAQPPKPALMAIIASIGIVLSLFGLHVFPIIADAASPYIGGIIGSKISLYGTFQAYELSIFSLALFLWHLGIMFIIYNYLTSKDDSSQFDIFTLYSTIMSVFAHSYLAALPAVWNRLMLVTFLVQIIYLVVQFRGILTLRKMQMPAIFGVAAVSFASLIHTLSDPRSLPYRPYQSALVFWWTGEVGDGRVRYITQMRESEAELKAQQGY